MAGNNMGEDSFKPFVGRQRPIDRDQLTADSEDDRMTHFQVNVGGVSFDGGMQNL
jgi:hypothetical protein